MKELKVGDRVRARWYSLEHTDTGWTDTTVEAIRGDAVFTADGRTWHRIQLRKLVKRVPRRVWLQGSNFSDGKCSGAALFTQPSQREPGWIEFIEVRKAKQ